MVEIKKYLDFDGLNIFWVGIKNAYVTADSALETAYKKADEDLGKRIDDEVTNRNNAIITAINGLNISNYATVSALDAVEEKVDAIERITEDEITNLLAS